MMDEELLKAAAAELSLCQLQSLEEIPEEPHVFSPTFERKMKRLINKTDHPCRRILLNTAAIFLAAILALAAFLSISPKARAVVSKWFTSICDNGVRFYSSGEVAAQEMPDYVLADLPKEYTLYETEHREDGSEYQYCGPKGEILKFAYYSGAKYTDLFIQISNLEHSAIPVGEETAHIYVSPSGEEASAIVWIDPDQELLFMISCIGNQEELLRFARCVEEK